MLITQELIQQLIKEENSLKVDAYINSTFKVSLATETRTFIFEFCRN